MAELLAIGFMSCNRVGRVEHSLGSVLAQTVDDLDVYICDDASTDGTFDKLRAMAAAYRGGKRLHLMRNEQRQGVIGNFNRIMAQAQADYVMFAHDDDESLPQRAAAIRAAIAAAAQPPGAIFSDAFNIGENGDDLGVTAMWPSAKVEAEDVARHGTNIVGAVATYSRRVYTEFGPVPPEAHFEDACCLFRAALLGNAIHLPQPLVRKRLDRQSLTGASSIMAETSGRDMRQAMIRNIRNLAATPAVWAKDLAQYESRLAGGATRAAQLRELIDNLARRVQGELGMLEHKPAALAYWLGRLLRGAAAPRNVFKLALLAYWPDLWRRYVRWRYRRIAGGPP